MRDFSADHRWLSINTATAARRSGALDRIIEACARARHPRDLALARPGRGDRPRAHRARWCATHGLELSGYCRGGMFPAIDAAGPRGRARRQPPRRRRGEDARRAPASCSSSAACPARSPARPHHKDIAARAPRGARRHRRDARVRARASACRWRSSRCTRCTRPTAPASTRSSRRSTSATRSTRRDSGALGVAVDVYHVWWDPKLEAQIAPRRPRAPARLPRLRLAGADARPAERPRHDGRRRDRDPAASARWVEAAGFAGYSEVEIFSTRELVEAAGRRGARHLHRAAPQRRLSSWTRARCASAACAGPSPSRRSAVRRARCDVERARDQHAPARSRCRARPAAGRCRSISVPNTSGADRLADVEARVDDAVDRARSRSSGAARLTIRSRDGPAMPGRRQPISANSTGTAIGAQRRVADRQREHARRCRSRCRRSSRSAPGRTARKPPTTMPPALRDHVERQAHRRPARAARRAAGAPPRARRPARR